MDFHKDDDDIIRSRKTPVLESLFNKVAGLEACNFIQKRLLDNWFPVFTL